MATSRDQMILNKTQKFIVDFQLSFNAIALKCKIKKRNSNCMIRSKPCYIRDTRTLINAREYPNPNLRLLRNKIFFFSISFALDSTKTESTDFQKPIVTVFIGKVNNLLTKIVCNKKRSGVDIYQMDYCWTAFENCYQQDLFMQVFVHTRGFNSLKYKGSQGCGGNFVVFFVFS
jgi:hypothetical protein